MLVPMNYSVLDMLSMQYQWNIDVKMPCGRNRTSSVAQGWGGERKWHTLAKGKDPNGGVRGRYDSQHHGRQMQQQWNREAMGCEVQAEQMSVVT